MRIRQEVKEEIAKENFCLELSKLQEEIPPIPTDCEVKDDKGNVRYRYASLKKIMEVMQPLLSKHGFSISFETEKTDKGEVKVVCILRHILGHSEKSSFTIPMETSKYMSDIQKMGSTLTYAKRYALSSMLNITTSDDIDGIEVEVISKEKKYKDTTPKEWKISEAQIKLVEKLCIEKNINQDMLNAILVEKFNIEKLQQLKSNEDFNLLLNFIDPEGAEERKRKQEEWAKKREQRENQ